MWPCTRPRNRWSGINRLHSIENRSTRLGWKLIDSLPTVYRPIHFSLHNFSWATCFSSSVCLSQPCTVLMVTRQLADMPTREIIWSLCKNDWTDRVAIWCVDWPWSVSFCIRWVYNPKSAVRDVSRRKSLVVIKYFAALYVANGWSRRMVKIERYTVLRRQRRIVNGLLQVGLPRVLKYSRVLDSKKYSSNVLVLEYSFNSACGWKFQFPVPVFQIKKQLLELYANLAPSPSSCDLIH